MSHVDVGVQHGKSHVNMAFFSQRCPHVNMAFFSQHGIDHVNMEHLFLMVVAIHDALARPAHPRAVPRCLKARPRLLVQRERVGVLALIKVAISEAQALGVLGARRLPSCAVGTCRG